MATFRPAVKANDSDIQKLIKYIPAEIVAAYTALVGYLHLGASADIPSNYVTYYIILLSILSAITPIWTFYAVSDTPSVDPPTKKKRAIFQAVIATLAFLIWVYAVGNPLLKAIICTKCTTTDCADCPAYSPVLGSIILVLFTILTPLLDRIIFGTILPAAREEKE